MAVVFVPGKTSVKRINIRFDQQAVSVINSIIHRKSAQQLTGLTPAEQSEILKSILITRNPGGSSLKVHIATKTAISTEFGTRTRPARPWVKKLQRGLADPLRAALANLLKTKR